MMRFLVTLCIVVLARGETWVEKYDAWSAGLKPGWIIEVFEEDSQRCHCMVPETEPSSAGLNHIDLSTPVSYESSFGVVIIPGPSFTQTTTTTRTTTTTPSTTSTFTTTTTPPSGSVWTGACNEEVTMSDGMVFTWTNPQYDGVTDYAVNDYTCTLTVTIPDTYKLFVANMEFEQPSHIFETASCSGDNLRFRSSTGVDESICGDVSNQTWTESQVYNGPLTFTLTWTSSANDGGEDVGFILKLSGSAGNLTTTTTPTTTSTTTTPTTTKTTTTPTTTSTSTTTTTPTTTSTTTPTTTSTSTTTTTPTTTSTTTTPTTTSTSTTTTTSTTTSTSTTTTTPTTSTTTTPTTTSTTTTPKTTSTSTTTTTPTTTSTSTTTTTSTTTSTTTTPTTTSTSTTTTTPTTTSTSTTTTTPTTTSTTTTPTTTSTTTTPTTTSTSTTTTTPTTTSTSTTTTTPTTTSTTTTSTTTSTSTTTTTPTTTSTSTTTTTSTSTTTTTPTTTSTTTTPTTTTSTSTTTTTSTTPTTTTSTSTSTSTSSTSTSTSTTTTSTTEASGSVWTGACNEELTMSAGMEFYMTNPQYDGVNDYAVNDYTCTLTVTIPASYMMFMVNMEFEQPSRIFETASCQGDNLKFISSSGVPISICGDVSDQTWTETQIFNGPLTFSLTWTSAANDGGEDVGFKLKLTGHDLMGK